MRKTIYLLSFIALLLYSKIIQSQFLPFYENKNSSNALLMMNLKGKVKSIQQISYKAMDNGGVIQKGEKGSLSDQSSVNSDFSMQFDDTARTVKEVFYNVKDLTINHRYDDTKNIEIVEQSESSGKVFFKNTYKYNDRGKVIEETMTQIFKDNVSFDNKFILKYDEKGNLIEKSYYSSRYKDESKSIYTYDSKGKLISKADYNEKNILWNKETYKVDTKGNIIERNYYKPDCVAIAHTFILKYDSNNNVIQKEYYQPAGKLSKTYSYKYEYDKTGNWVKRIDFENGKATFILERQLEYY